MGRLIGKAHLVVLALYLDQKGGNTAQQPDANRLIVDIGTRARICRNRTPQNDRLMRIIQRDTLLGKKLMDRMPVWNFETGRNRSLLGPGAHKAAAGAVAKRKPQRVEENGFARTGLTRKDSQTRMKRQVEPLDKNHIAYREVSQHEAES
ncbi:hypothetical protein GCM10007207_23800 [Asaia siamensis]|uniref:Uncharacterized protein n=1 Tax=Asaia siamensis TaxID=110479 RepID=A0ABQ1MA95_9PROT|nr:hypothetical protein AA0323_1746 [Asaia siamensis NRIC 0323]GGC37517.1 hypothetical protein GCM10007207_23800 [Asaia siamensis]